MTAPPAVAPGRPPPARWAGACGSTSATPAEGWGAGGRPLVAAQVWQICNRGCRAAPGGPTPTRAGGCGPSAPAAPANEHPGPRLRPGATAQVGQTQLKIAEPTPSCRLLEKGATCDAGGPSLGRKRPRRAAVTQAATAPQQYDPALHNAQAKKVSKCCSINARRRPLPEQMSTLYQHVRENPERSITVATREQHVAVGHPKHNPPVS